MKTDNIPDGTSDEECSDPDPRIQAELDKLNTASTEINRLENELDEARSKYRSIVSGTSGQMEVIAHSRKKSIQKAREYYKLSVEAKLAQSEALKAARQYQTAVGVYKAAKETVALAESRLTENTSSSAAQLTSAWQEMLNHAIEKVAEAEKERAKSEQNHKRRSAKYAELQTRIQLLEKKFSRSIKKARPYFELKAELDVKLMQQKQNVSDILTAIRCYKMKYTESLRKLESISEEIHQTRREKFWAKVPRMPGVGADIDSVASSLSEMDLKSTFSSEWSECGDEEFDTEVTTDDEVFDVTFEVGKNNSADLETNLPTKINSLTIVEQHEHKESLNERKYSQSNTESSSDIKRVIKKTVCDRRHEDTDDKGKDRDLCKSSSSDSGINTSASIESDKVALNSGKQSLGIESRKSSDTIGNSFAEDGHLKKTVEEENYSGCDMQSVERPSLSGEED